MNNVWQKLLQLDIFGRGVEFFFKGQQEFKTKWGCVVTAFIVTTYLIIFLLRLTEFFGETDPIEYFSQTRQSMDERIDLNKLGFTFAVENIEARIGRIEVSQVDWDGTDGIKRSTPIELVNCEELSPWGLPLTNSYTQARIASKGWDAPSFLCPDQSEEMAVWGSFNN